MVSLPIWRGEMWGCFLHRVLLARALVVDPDIRLAWYERALHIDGQLTVPRALIAPSVLPATPVVESPDVELVSGQLPESDAVAGRQQYLKVFGSLEVVLGEQVDIDLSVTEADLRSYPGLYLAGTGKPALRGILPAYPAEEEQVNDRTVRVVTREPFLARTEGPRTFPWRVFVVADEDADLVRSTIVWRLAPSLRIADPS